MILSRISGFDSKISPTVKNVAKVSFLRNQSRILSIPLNTCGFFLSSLMYCCTSSGWYHSSKSMPSRFRSGHRSIFLTTLAGFPTTTQKSGTSSNTTLPALTRAFSPIVTPAVIMHPGNNTAPDLM